MNINDIVKISNECLSNGFSFKATCNELNISDKTLKKHLNAFGYIYNAKEKKIELASEVATATDENVEFVRVEEFKALQAQVEQILEMISVTTPTLPIEIKRVESVSNRTYKVDNDILERFTKFCDNNRQYRVQDIISTALEQFLDVVEK